MCVSVVFDLDGTIVDTEYEIAAFTADLAQEKGCHIDAVTAFRRYAGVSFKDKFNMIAGCYDRSFLPEELTAMHQAYTARKEGMYKNRNIPTIKGAPELVMRLAADNSNVLSLASSNQTKRSRRVLSAIGLNKCFGERVYGSDMTGGLKKPDPSIHLLALKEYPDSIIIEDSIAGVVGARAAGAKLVVAYVDPRLGDEMHRKQEYAEAGAHIVIDTYDDFEERVLAARPRFLIPV